MMPDRRLWLLTLLALVGGWSTAGAAATCTMNVQGVNFGAYDPLANASVNGTGTVNVTCDAQVSGTISLSAGSGTYAQRTMSSSAMKMQYNLYTDSARTQIWGDGTGGSSVLSGTTTSGAFPVYGRIPGGQKIGAGSYSDTIVVTIAY